MKILLVAPAQPRVAIAGDDLALFEPLALEYLGAAVKGDHDVRLLDQRIDPDVPGALEEFQPDIVGITAYTVHLRSVRGLFGEVKRWSPETLTVVGGHHATVAPGDFACPDIDIIVTGEGVLPFRQIVERHARRSSLEGIPGTAVAGPGGIRLIEPDPVDLDALPVPERSLTVRYRHRYHCDWMRPLASLRTSKGCPHRCRFCALWRIARKRYLKRSPEAIVDELSGIEEPCVFFADDESLVDAGRMKELARRIGEAGIRKRFFLYGRSDTIARNPDLLEAWRDVGLERIFVGLEFASDDDLDDIRKGSTASDNERAVRILHDLDIEIYASLLVRPEFTQREFASLASYCRRLGLGYVGFSVLTPLPGTEYYEEVEEELLTRDTDLFDFVHTVLPTRLPLERFYAEYVDLYPRAMSPARRLAFLMKHRLRDIPGVLSMSQRLMRRMRRAYGDYSQSTICTS